ncbi:MAG: hypothetical protein Q8O04_06090 [Deltaproteobacteria bacterium]|nr:hypothetical protein [Deltaproteobacteria bacterium]
MSNGSNASGTLDVASGTPDVASGTPDVAQSGAEKFGERLRELHDIGDKTPKEILDEQ